MEEDRENCPILKELVGLIIKLQDTEEGFIELAQKMGYAEGGDAMNEWKVKTPNRKLGQRGDGGIDGAIRRHLDKPKADRGEKAF